MSESSSLQPLTPIRRMIAARTTEAKQTIPHFRLREDIETDALGAWRAELECAHPQRRPSVNDFIVRACADSLMATPALNIQWSEEGVRRLENADISVVVALEDGLSTPVVRGAERKSVWEISGEIRALCARARGNALRMDEILGGSFSISNLGMYGVPEFDAIINPPQCAILAVGAARRSLLPGADGEVRVASLMRVTLSCDHRAVDGATGAAFLGVLKQRLESAEHLRRMTDGTP